MRPTPCGDTPCRVATLRVVRAVASAHDVRPRPRPGHLCDQGDRGRRRRGRAVIGRGDPPPPLPRGRRRGAGSGGAEQGPEALLDSVLVAGRRALAEAGVPISAVALANQGETVLAWDRATG